jgi:hypothetical protein
VSFVRVITRFARIFATLPIIVIQAHPVICKIGRLLIVRQEINAADDKRNGR